jgi:hypothetical protein
MCSAWKGGGILLTEVSGLERDQRMWLFRRVNNYRVRVEFWEKDAEEEWERQVYIYIVSAYDNIHPVQYNFIFYSSKTISTKHISLIALCIPRGPQTHSVSTIQPGVLHMASSYHFREARESMANCRPVAQT